MKKTHTGLIKFDGETDEGYNSFLYNFSREILAHACKNASSKWDHYSLVKEAVRGAFLFHGLK